MNLFNDDQTPLIDPNKNYLPELVGPDKKYKDEPALARSVVEKDAFIEQLKREQRVRDERIAQLEAEGASRARLEEIAERIANASKEAPVSKVEPQVQPEKQGLSNEEIDQRVEHVVSNLASKKTAEQNYSDSKDYLTEKYGPAFAGQLVKIAKTLNVTDKYLNELAVSSPTAFKKLVEAADPSRQPVDVRTPQGSVNTLGMSPSNEPKTYTEAIKTLKAMHPKDFNSPRVQQKLWTLAKKYGQSFFD